MPLGEPGPGPLDELVARLTAAGLPPDARGMADALWLAQWITPEPSTAQGTDEGGGTGGADGAHGAKGAGADRRPDRADPATFRVGPPVSPGLEGGTGAPFDGDRSPDPAAGEAASAAALREAARRGLAELLPARHERSTDPDRYRLGEVAVPIASAFPGLLPLQRALRPVQRYRPPTAPARRKLDERATAELSAHAEMVIPVLRGVHRRTAGLRLLMDGSSSMAVWEQMLHDLRQVCERVGAFRDVTVHYLHPHGADVGVTAAPGPGRPLRPADQLHDPTGHHLTLVVSDCAGPLWHDGRMQRLLYRWAADAPLAVVQPLPQRMWGRTLLPAVAGTLVRRQGPYQPLDFRPARRRRRPAPPPGTETEPPRERAVPVLAATPSALGSWARLAAADAGLSLRGAASVVRADHGAEPRSGPPPTPGSGEPSRMVREFDRQASPAARLLAVHLSAVPLALPVIQLVQRAMLPQTGPAELAEVLLSGLVTQVPPEEFPPGERAPGAGPPEEQLAATGPWYDFVPGVRDELLARLSAGEAALVLKHCSLYIERTFGRSARNFPAVAVAMLSGSGREPETGRRAVPEPFARVSERVLRRFEPALRPPDRRPYASDGPAAEGAALLERYEQDRAVRDLIEAVRLLRAAAERLPPAGTDLARALLHAWAEWRQPDALEEAERAVRAAERALGAAPPADTAERDGSRQDSRDGSGPGSRDDDAGAVERTRVLIVLGRVAHARARERRAAGDPAGERTALAEAARQLDAACGLMSLLDPRVLESMVLRTEVLRRLAALPDTAAPPETSSSPGPGAPAGPSASPGPATSPETAATPGAPAAQEPGATLAPPGRAGAEGAAGQPPPPDPLDEAERSLTTLLDRWPSGEQVPGEVYAARGGVLLDQARRAAARRPEEPGAARPAEALAVRAADDLDTATVLLRRRGSDADRLVCETLLDLAAARRLGGGAGLPSVLPTLERARAIAQALGDPALEADSLRRIAAAQRGVHTRTGAVTALDAAIDALAAALRLTAPDSPVHSSLLAERGAALLLRARQEPAGEPGRRLADEAVHVLREALARVAPQDPDLGSHRLLFGRALRLRHERRPSVADLHEADWVLELAARGAGVPDVVCAEAWIEVGDVQLLLDRRFGSRERHDRAAACYRRAAAAAGRAGSALLAARAHHRRAEVLEVTAGPRSALQAYRESWEHWQRTAADPGPEAQRTRARMRALESPA
ncbi:SAV_2336 N-terminal domain-related protein [Streptomyces sp. NRRL S-337]|uniref:SAV_2336 N-terminal domain-related protein n=1 Tax=Streptomyces sp. NRRL S-337 TaxID=1463900 RepID=UPI0004C65166|nr:SAV_2336 N-terminal domain-related protein [Streptomyces sp. NRRL S-337]